MKSVRGMDRHIKIVTCHSRCILVKEMSQPLIPYGSLSIAQRCPSRFNENYDFNSQITPFSSVSFHRR